jgi:hypothetical protein
MRQAVMTAHGTTDIQGVKERINVGDNEAYKFIDKHGDRTLKVMIDL